MARGEIELHRKRGEDVPLGMGLDSAGGATTKPADILDGGVQLPFGLHKGSNISIMVELLGIPNPPPKKKSPKQGPPFDFGPIMSHISWRPKNVLISKFVLAIRPARPPPGAALVGADLAITKPQPETRFDTYNRGLFVIAIDPDATQSLAPAILGGEPLLQGLEDDDTRLPSNRRYRRRKETLGGDLISVPSGIYNQIMALVNETPSKL